MRRLVARNASLGTVIADHVGVAATRAARAVGLLSRTGLEPGEALWIVPSRGVHTWGMRFTIDVLALDDAGTVIDCVSNLRPWRVRLPRRGFSSWPRRRCSDDRRDRRLGARPAPRRPGGPAAARPARDDCGDGAAPRRARPVDAEDADRRGEHRHPARGQPPRAVLRVRGARAARPGREAGGSPRRRRGRDGRLPLRAHRPRPRSREPVPRHLPVRRPRARADRAVQRPRARRHGGEAVDRPRDAVARLRPPRRQPGHVRPARARRQLRQVAVSVRRAGQRQDGRRRRHRPRPGQRHARAVRDRRRRPDHHHVRSGQPRVDVGGGRLAERRRRGGARSAVGTAACSSSTTSAASGSLPAIC